MQAVQANRLQQLEMALWAHPGTSLESSPGLKSLPEHLRRFGSPDLWIGGNPINLTLKHYLVLLLLFVKINSQNKFSILNSDQWRIQDFP